MTYDSTFFLYMLVTVINYGAVIYINVAMETLCKYNKVTIMCYVPCCGMSLKS